MANDDSIATLFIWGMIIPWKIMNQLMKQILLVENSKTARMSLEMKLTNTGYAVHSVGSGKEAVTLAQAKSFDLIIMDLFLPDLNGYEAAKLIKLTNFSTKPIVAYSSSDNPFDRAKCAAAGIELYILKSVDHKELMDQISKLLN